MIIDRGRIVADGTPSELLTRSRHHNAVSLLLPTDQAELARARLKSMNDVISVEQTTRPDGLSMLTAFPRQGALLIEDVSALVMAEHWDVRELYAEPGRLEDVFRAVTTHDAARARAQASGAGA